MVRVNIERNMKTKNKNYINFQRNLLTSPKCDGCIFDKCEVIFDAHHDEYFSNTCGLVIIQSGAYMIEYGLFFEDEEDM